MPSKTMRTMHLRIKHRSKSTEQAPAGAHVRYVLREPEAGAGPHAEYVVRASPSLAAREDLLASGYGNLPEWSGNDPVEFFAAGDVWERANGRVCVQIDAVLPRELPVAQQVGAVKDFIQSQLGTQHAYVYGIHQTTASDGKPYPHVHIAFSERVDTGTTQTPQEYFARNGCQKDRYFSARGFPAAVRHAWADTLNVSLERAGSVLRVDPRSFRDQGKDIEPVKYVRDLRGRKDLLAERPERDIDQAAVQRYWEDRKRQLGITDTLDHATKVQRIGEASRRQVQDKSRGVASEEEVARLQARVNRIHGVVMEEEHRLKTGRAQTPAQAARVAEALREEPAKGRGWEPELTPRTDRGRGRGYGE
jgi:hypothetical protein